MTEEIAREAAQILSDIKEEEQKLVSIVEMRANALGEYNVPDILHSIRENSDLFEPTLKQYFNDTLDKAIGEKKELIDRMKLVLDML